MSFKFKPEDFDLDSSSQEYHAASQANELLQAHLATLPKVYGVMKNGRAFRIQSDTDSHDTHTALLWGISEIKKKECEHNNILAISMPNESLKSGPYIENLNPRFDCADCGVKLKAKWEKA